MILKKLELFAKKSFNLKIKKQILFLISHIELLYKYGTNQSGYWLDFLSTNPRVMSQLDIVVDSFTDLLRPYAKIVDEEYRHLKYGYVSEKGIKNLLEHFVDLLEISLAGEEEIEEGNVFLGIDEKLKRANRSAREGNAEGLFSNLHTIIELILKDKLGIALDMDGVRLGKVLSLCIQYEIFIGKNSILKQLNDNVCSIDNKIKHSGYNPTAKQMNDGLLVATQAVRVLKKNIPKPNDEALEEISKILVKHN